EESRETPSIAVMTSPRRIPARAAGLPKSTEYTLGQLPNRHTAAESSLLRLAVHSLHWNPNPNQPRGTTRIEATGGSKARKLGVGGSGGVSASGAGVHASSGARGVRGARGARGAGCGHGRGRGAATRGPAWARTAA